MVLYGVVLAADGTKTRYVLDSSSLDAGLPNTLHVAHISNDTLFKEMLELDVIVADSATDVAGAIAHDVHWFLIAH